MLLAPEQKNQCFIFYYTHKCNWSSYHPFFARALHSMHSLIITEWKLKSGLLWFTKVCIGWQRCLAGRYVTPYPWIPDRTWAIARRTQCISSGLLFLIAVCGGVLIYLNPTNEVSHWAYHLNWTSAESSKYVCTSSWRSDHVQTYFERSVDVQFRCCAQWVHSCKQYTCVFSKSWWIKICMYCFNID